MRKSLFRFHPEILLILFICSSLFLCWLEKSLLANCENCLVAFEILMLLPIFAANSLAYNVEEASGYVSGYI